jgi:hypothetical protein
MGRTYDEIDDRLREFLQAQPVFFTGTAPLEGGHVNVSPKGLAGTFAVLGPTTVAYLDLSGSGVETIAHLRENGRITIMFCAFDGPPRIVRLQGRGEVVMAADPRCADLLPSFDEHVGVRSVIVVEVDRIADSCGYGVPRMTYDGDRTQLAEFAERKGPEGLVEYQLDRNATSIDGLPGIGPTDVAETV